MQAQLTTPGRIQSVDLLRGAVMVLMAIDHVRVYSGLPAGGPDPGIFFTRWVTHFCAPGFVFFAGTSAFLYGKKLGDAGALARYLLTRGLLLVVLELTFIRFCWSFNLRFSEFILAGVIWMLGWCMILLAFVVRMRPLTIAVLGLLIIFFQQVFALVPKALPIGGFWEFIYPSGNEPAWGIAVLYVVVPWIGVMMAGYGFGAILLMEPERRAKLCLRIGLAAIALYILGGTVMILSAPVAEEARPFIFRLLNQQKYPASQLFLLMTIGPVIALSPWAEKVKGTVADMFVVIGRVPFFYYMLHIPLIHISALAVNAIRTGSAHGEWYDYAPFSNVPPESWWNLGLLYLVFAIDTVILYFASRWYARYKLAHPEKAWLKYL